MSSWMNKVKWSGHSVWLSGYSISQCLIFYFPIFCSYFGQEPVKVCNYVHYSNTAGTHTALRDIQVNSRTSTEMITFHYSTHTLNGSPWYPKTVCSWLNNWLPDLRSEISELHHHVLLGDVIMIISGCYIPRCKGLSKQRIIATSPWAWPPLVSLLW